MKKVFTQTLALAAICLLASCNNLSQRRIEPLPPSVSLDNLTDCTVSASFNTDDINWDGSSLTMTVYEKTLYDAADINRMSVGDTLFYEGNDIVVEAIQDNDGYITVNGGFDNGGADLVAGDGGTYRANTFDDHPVYICLGEVELPLDGTFVIRDCGPEPLDPEIVITDGQKAYLDELEGYRKSFSALDTRVRIEKGSVKEIIRTWIP